ncbi:MAG: hypothetical protein PVH88_15635 [Ignavibacteria bacterium]|jgi:hypothetical protein
MKQLPKHLYSLFWDINIKTFKPIEHPDYTISRVLELGNEKAVTWIKATFSEEQIKNVIKSNHRLSQKSANFWAILYDIPVNKVRALTKII